MRGTALAASFLLLLGGCAGKDTARRATPVPAASAAGRVPKAFQWMGSGEAAAMSRQAYGALTRYVLAQLPSAQAGMADSVILAEGSTPVSPRWVPCGARSPAVVLDIDETSILNTGANYDTARRGDPTFDPARWSDWEAHGADLVDPVPGAVEALAALRAAGVTPVFISNRQADHGTQSARALAAAGLGTAVPGETMLLREAGRDSGKDDRRAIAAARYCVMAMVGDQLGDFSDLFNAKALAPADRRRLAQGTGIASKWGAGWFLLPNPLYGPGDAGTLDQVFPDHHWSGPKSKETN